MDTFQFTHEALPGRLVFAPGAIAAVAAEVRRLGKRALVVHGTFVQPLAERLSEDLDGTVVGIFDGVVQHVPRTAANEALALARDVAADVLVSIGGGSSTGFAKAIALDHPAPILALPTTYAGSEMTPIWGLTADGQKRTGRDNRVLPATVVYDPELTLTLPPSLTATSGLNALAHAVEALYAPGADPILELTATSSVRLITDGLPVAVAEGNNVEARSKSLLGACLAGRALAGAGTSVHHKLCHVLGGRHDLPHAPTHAVLLPYVLRAIAHLVPAALTELARTLDHDDPVAAIFALQEAVGAPTTLAEIGMPEQDLEESARLGYEPSRRVLPGVTPEIVTSILHAAFHGDRA